MKIFIEKIFNGEHDKLVHARFQKYSKGIYEQKALVEAKESKGKYSINTTNEYTNELVRALAEELQNKTSHVSGKIITTKDLRDELEFESMTQFAGVKMYILNKELSGNQIIELLDKFPTAFFALSLKTETSELKTKPKSPKSPKAGAGEEKQKVDFCKIKTTNKELANSLLFGGTGKKISISHTFEINEIEIPKGITDIAEMREAGIRKGKIIRKILIDDKETIIEHALRA